MLERALGRAERCAGQRMAGRSDEGDGEERSGGMNVFAETKERLAPPPTGRRVSKFQEDESNASARPQIR